MGMNKIYLKLTPANKKCTTSFKDVAKNKYHNMPIFEFALEYVNYGDTFTRAGKALYLEEIHDDCLIIRLESKTPLKMASKSLAGFTRKLISIDNEMGTHIFDDFIYNNTVFKNTEVPAPEKEDLTVDTITNTEALKLCVDIFSNDVFASAEEEKYYANVNRAIKGILVDYSRTKRLKTYAVEIAKRIKEAKHE